MPIPADARFWLARALGLWRRGWASLRTRGLRASWARLRAQFARRPAPTTVLWRPEPAPFAPFALATSGQPRASVVIPVHGAFPHTLACLRALAAYPPAVPFEVIVVDDASADDTLARLGQVAGVRVHARATNGGFIAACNEGAALARGDWLVFLNNDTVPQPGWLDALLRTFDTQPDVGLVGAKLVYPDGRLQEAGIQVSLIFLLGAGGRQLAREHLEQTRRLLSQLQLTPGDRIYLSDLLVHSGSDYATLSEQQGLQPLSRWECRQQARELRESLNLPAPPRGTPVALYDVRQFVYV